jgi:hypothetical protein
VRDAVRRQLLQTRFGLHLGFSGKPDMCRFMHELVGLLSSDGLLRNAR